MTDEVKVEQCDREAAADIVSGILSELTCEHIRRGLYDGDHMVQRVAEVRRLHSVAARPAPAEDAVEVARVLDAIRDRRDSAGGSASYRQACNHIIEAVQVIAAMQPRGEQQAGRGLLTEARAYGADALDAHEHSDGRGLLKRIDAALKPEAVCVVTNCRKQSPAEDPFCKGHRQQQP